MRGLEVNILIPDLWQQEAVRALRAGRDVIIDAPTGAGKTYIFELLYPELREQAIYTVPTRALANDKLAEWRRQGWDVGIATGDLSWRTDARVVVATLETQKGRFLRRQGPRLLVVDEYQMVGDELRGVNYELALALAPPETQLLLMSGSVGNPQEMVDWLGRIERDAVLISHRERPVPLEEINLEMLPNRAPPGVRGFWPRTLYNALAAGMGPILIFAPRRNATEDMARALAAALPSDDSLQISPEQERLAGTVLSKLLRNRIAFHHSGLSYKLRAGLIEPLAKNGHLRIVVATMGLASGINFSMRSVMVMDTQYMAGNFERHVRPDELLQMFGRAGRRGLDDVGYVLGTPDQPRLLDARPKRLRRARPIDWPAAIAVMRAAREGGEDPFSAALDFTRRLFSDQKIPLGVERSRETGAMPCGLSVDMERARFARRGMTEMRNSRGEWEPLVPREFVTLAEMRVRAGHRWRPALSIASSLNGIGKGNLCKLRTDFGRRYGRELHAAVLSGDGNWLPSKWLRRVARLYRMPRIDLENELRVLLPKLTGGGVVWEYVERAGELLARIDYGSQLREARRDRYGVALSGPETREARPAVCENCSQRSWCTTVEIHSQPADAWRRLGLIERYGTPTVRGVIFSFFNSGEGLAVAAAIEDAGYPVEDILFDLANLRAGPRFAGDDSPYSGRLGALCQQSYDRADYTGYLTMGVPLNYGAGAAEIVREVIMGGVAPQKLLSERTHRGDIERALVEWRSLVKHIATAPDFPNDRWMALKSACARFVESGDRSILDLPALLPSQMQRRQA
jgi:superfamily II DNA/RNA helicase